MKFWTAPLTGLLASLRKGQRPQTSNQTRPDNSTTLKFAELLLWVDNRSIACRKLFQSIIFSTLLYLIYARKRRTMSDGKCCMTKGPKRWRKWSVQVIFWHRKKLQRWPKALILKHSPGGNGLENTGPPSYDSLTCKICLNYGAVTRLTRLTGD